MVMVGSSEDPEDLMENEEAIDAVSQCDSILEACDDVPERSEDFAESVREKDESMRESIVRNDSVTPKMLKSLDNMEEAIDRCIERGW